MNSFNFTMVLLVVTCFASSHGGLMKKVLQSMGGGMYGPGYNGGPINGHHGMNGPIPVAPHGLGQMVGHMGGPVGGHIGGPMGGHIGGPIGGHIGGPIGGHIGGPMVGPVGPNIHSGGKPEPKYASGGRDYYGFRNPRLQG